jgi:hypothetical protein
MRNETFDINDGADFLFEKRIMGEANSSIDLGMFGGSGLGFESDSKVNESDSGVEEITAILSNATNLNKCQEIPAYAHPQAAKPPLKPVTPKTKPVTQNKENNSRPPHNPLKGPQMASSSMKQHATNKHQTTASPETAIGGSTSSGMSSAIEHMSASSSLKPSLKTTTSLLQLKKQQSLQLISAPVIKKAIAPPSHQLSSGYNANIVKKTFAKMSAAFKSSKASQPTSEVKLKLTQNSKNVKTKMPVAKDDFYSGNQMFQQRQLVANKDESSDNRRASSVPRTLREKQELLRKAGKESAVNDILKDEDEPAPNQILPPSQTTTLGEKIQNFFNSNVSHPSQTTRTTATQKIRQQNFPKNNKNGPLKASSAVATSQAADRRRSRSCNEKIVKTNGSIQAIAPRKSRLPSVDLTLKKTNNNNNNNNSLIKAAATGSPSMSQGIRQKSADRSIPQIAMYHGLRFVPKQPTKYHLSQHEPDKLEELFKNRPISLTRYQGSQQQQQQQQQQHQTKGPFFGPTSAAKGPLPAKSASFKSKLNTTADNAHPTAPIKDSSSTGKNTSLNCSGAMAIASANRSRKPSESKPTNLSISNCNASHVIAGGPMHSELRALKRNEYDQQQKEKERQAMAMRRDLDAAKMKKQQEEIQKIRNQRHTFRSRPIKHYKPIEVKSSEKPLTEPKSPNLSTSQQNISQLPPQAQSNRPLQARQRLKSASSMLSLHFTETNATNSNLRRNSQNKSLMDLDLMH